MSATPEQIAERLDMKLEQAVMICPDCLGEGGYPDGLDENAVHTVCLRCGGNCWIVDGDAIAAYLSATSDAQAERVRVLEEAGKFLVDRLTDFQRDGDVRTIDGERDWGGNVAPALSRFRAALKAAP